MSHPTSTVDLDVVRAGGGEEAVRVGSRRYTDQQFRDAIADPEVRTIADLCRALGIVPRGGNYELVRRSAERLGVEVPRVRRRAASVPIDDDRLREAVASSRSIAAVLRELGLPDAGGTRARVTSAIARLDLDTSHQRGQGWSAGRQRPDTWTRLDQLGDGKIRSGYTIRSVLLRNGWEHRCQECGRTGWEGGPIPLEVDHIDGDRRNGRVGNLRLLCPNCHALTPTYRGRNIGRPGGSPSAG